MDNINAIVTNIVTMKHIVLVTIFALTFIFLLESIICFDTNSIVSGMLFLFTSLVHGIFIGILLRVNSINDLECLAKVFGIWSWLLGIISGFVSYSRIKNTPDVFLIYLFIVAIIYIEVAFVAFGFLLMRHANTHVQKNTFIAPQTLVFDFGEDGNMLDTSGIDVSNYNSI